MATEFISQSTVNYATRTNTLIPAPINIQDGDQLGMIFVIFSNSPAAPTPTFPTGFNSVGGVYPLILLGDDLAVHAVTKEAASEVGDYEVVHTEANTTVFMVVVRGSSGLGAISGIISATEVVDIDSVTTINNESFVLLFAQSSNFLGAVTPPGAPPTFDERFDSALSILYAATGIMATAGATGNKIMTMTEGPSSGGMIVFEAAIAPPSGGGGVGYRFDDWY
jgi:hypothetical protein